MRPFPSCSSPAVRTVLTFALGLVIGAASGAEPDARATTTKVAGWNNLGMHCLDDDFSIFSLLPPYNTIYAQIVQNGSLVQNLSGLTVTYEAVADPAGSINRTSIGKTNFWAHVNDLYGAAPAADMGLAGFAMPGAANVPQALGFDLALDACYAEGIPITPYDDLAAKNPYPMMRVVVRNTVGTVLASTDIVLPVSDEMNCLACHASGSGTAAEPTVGWINDPDPIRDYRLNVLLKHDELQVSNPQYATLLTAAGYNAAGLYPTVVPGNKAVLCAACHLSNALPGTGAAGVPPLTEVIHGGHASVTDPTSGLTLDQATNRTACYRCHPGSQTRCLRGAMGAAVASDGSYEMQCQSCHGNMSAVGQQGREGWLEEPTCQNCHTGTAVLNSGEIRYTTAFDSPGNLRVAADLTFATNPDTPVAGVSLFRLSAGHGGLMCSMCHGSPHAIYPSSHISDNVQNVALQGHKGTLGECSSCHVLLPNTVTGGPHGMHPVGGHWVNDHADVAEGGAQQCRKCHGTDYRGTVLAAAFGDRVLNTKFGTKTLWRGFRVTCYTCHNGPSSESKANNSAPQVSDLAEATDNATPVPITLKATDKDNDPLTLRIVEQPQHGTVGLVGKVATYYPAADFLGIATFTYAACDNKTDSNLGTVTVTVDDAGCPLTLSEAGWTFDAGGGTHDVTVTTPAGCSWTAAVDLAASSWLFVQAGASGTGPGFVSYLVAANASSSARTGTITIGSKTHVVKQGGLTSANLTGMFKKVKEKCSGPSCRLVLIFKVRNVGSSKAAASTVGFYLSDDALLDAGDTLLVTKNYGALKPGKSQKKKVKVYLAGGVSASGKYVIAAVDVSHAVPEADEGDNTIVFGPVP